MARKHRNNDSGPGLVCPVWIRLDKTQSAHSEFGLPPSSDLSRLSGEPLLDIRHKKARLYVEALLLVVGPLSSRRMTMTRGKPIERKFAPLKGHNFRST
jgi:hypothetical protein